MKKISKNIQNDIKFSKNKAKSPSSKGDRQGLMLKMVTTYSIFLFVILILFFYLYTSGARNALNQYEWQQKSTLMSNVELFENDLDIMDAYCRQLLQNGNLKELLDIDSSNERFLELGNQIAGTMASDVYLEALLPISECFCYLPGAGYVLAPGYFTTQEVYYNQIRRYSADTQEAWMKALTSPSNYYCFTPLHVATPPSEGKDCQMYLINIGDAYHLDADAVVCFVFEEKNLFPLFDCLNIDADYHYLSVHTDNADMVLSLSADLDSLLDSAAESGQTTKDKHALETLLTSADISLGCYISENTGFTYYFSYPSFDATSNFARPQILYCALFVTALIFGILLVFLLTKRNLQPILDLDQELQKANQEKTSLIEEKSHLQEVMDNQKPIICNSYVRKLLKGMIASEEEAVYAKEFLGLKEKNLVYNALYIVAYNNADVELSAASEPRSLEECNIIIIQTLQGYMGDKFYYFSPTDRAYALIVVGNSEDEKNLISNIQKMIGHMHNELLASYGIWLFAGIGKNTDDIVNVWECYQQAMEAASYASRNNVFFPYEQIKKDSSAFYYPTELSTKLIHFITTGNTPQVLELFNLLHQENIEERSLPINMLQFLLSDIRNTLLKARFALPQNTPKDTLKALDECFNQHVSFKLCEDIALRLCQLFTVETDNSSLISAIEKYIKENYADPSMGLNKIADEFQISESYFSHMFKEKTGVNFSIYLENMRMSEAARLIKETDTSLNELYLSVGYNNANTFRRAFKKVYGVTPSSMRDTKAI